MTRIIAIVTALLGYLFLIGHWPTGHGPEVDGSSEGSKAPAPEARRCSWVTTGPSFDVRTIGGQTVVLIYGVEGDWTAEG